MPEPRNHDGENLDQAWDRLSDNVEDPFDRHRNSRGRVGWKDLPHAVTNIPVTAARERPWLIGHYSLWATLAMIGLLILALVLIF